jgi:MFS family permease
MLLAAERCAPAAPCGRHDAERRVPRSHGRANHVGLAWSFGIIASSGLLTDAFPVTQRATIQGAGDLCMATFGALAGISAGAIVAAGSYRTLNLAAASLGVVLVVAVLATATTNWRRPRTAAAPSFS